MNCVVTAGPTYEPLDEVRRLINFSTGRLGTELANYLVAHGHNVTLLLGHQATWRVANQAQKTIAFTTTTDLHDRLKSLAAGAIEAVFHAAAVSDFGFGKIYRRLPNGDLEEVRSGKISSRLGPLLAELVATPKIINALRGWFPEACLIGWKYEMDGDRTDAIAEGEKQIRDTRVNACVVNGRAYGHGFGLVSSAAKCLHFKDSEQLFAELERFASAPPPGLPGRSSTPP